MVKVPCFCLWLLGSHLSIMVLSSICSSWYLILALYGILITCSSISFLSISSLCICSSSGILVKIFINSFNLPSVCCLLSIIISFLSIPMKLWRWPLHVIWWWCWCVPPCWSWSFSFVCCVLHSNVVLLCLASMVLHLHIIQLHLILKEKERYLCEYLPLHLIGTACFLTQHGYSHHDDTCGWPAEPQ